MWFKKQAQQVSGVTPEKLTSSDSEAFAKMTYLNASAIGKMIMYYYDPKTKEKLPYYDTFPLVFPIETSKRGKNGEPGFLGINLHYLSPFYRAQLFDALYRQTLKGLDEKRRLQISYGILKSASQYSMFKPCVKHYLYPHVRSRFFVVNPKEWDVVLMLPTERFVQGGGRGGSVGGYMNKRKVWTESEGKF